MRILGIDYGSKRIGVAITDPSGHFPSPFGVILNNEEAIKKVTDICKENEIKLIVIGKSVNYQGRPNEILNLSQNFGDKISTEAGVPVEFENETLTSKEAERIIGRDEKYDARAAALILKSYIDRNF